MINSPPGLSIFIVFVRADRSHKPASRLCGFPSIHLLGNERAAAGLCLPTWKNKKRDNRCGFPSILLFGKETAPAGFVFLDLEE